VISQAVKSITLAAVTAVSLTYAQAPGKRSSFNVPLANLSVSFNDETHVFEKVRVSFGAPGDDDNYYCLIAPGADYEIKVSREGRQKFVHNEAPDKAYMISEFEAEVLNKVCKTFVSTLEIFEHDLQHEKWDRLLYLDSYFPRFLRGFYYLYCSARNSPYALPKGICIPDTVYDVSLTSPKSDERIRLWKQTSDNIIKLRIISKELIYQIKDWQDKELDNSKRNIEVSYGKKFEEAFTLFVKIYFNLQPLPDVPRNGEHL
jgi:hypothetical protein